MLQGVPWYNMERIFHIHRLVFQDNLSGFLTQIFEVCGYDGNPIKEYLFQGCFVIRDYAHILSKDIVWYTLLIDVKKGEG